MKCLSIEQGPIRPPSEARSLLLRVTRNCNWNQCQFCTTYTDQRFARRSVEEVKADIDTIAEIVKEAKTLSWRLGLSGRIDGMAAQHLLEQPGVDVSYQSVVAWLFYGTNAVFLQDANNIVLKADDLVQMLEYLNQKVPGISRITSYARTKTAARKSLEDLTRMRQAGLDRLHVGVESGDDVTLKFMKKGVTAKEHIEGGRKVVQAGMELSEYYMPGLGGRARWKEHALGTARVVSESNPHFIRLRTLHVIERHPLYQAIQSGDFALRTPSENIEEIRLFVENLEGVTSYLASDHMGNLLQDVEGRLPDDKPRMLDALDRYLDLDEDSRLHYRVGRVLGVYNGVKDMSDPGMFRQVEAAMDKIRAQYPDRVDEVLTDAYSRMTRL
jgi:radical SAM superfamily enzyme YgiQ (UPF0313 family)